MRYAIYTRQSVEKLADFSSCQAQFNTCQDFVAALNDPLLRWCGQQFDDEGQSGSTLDRPAMQKLRKVVVRAGLVDGRGQGFWQASKDAILLWDSPYTGPRDDELMPRGSVLSVKPGYDSSVPPK
ncbi:MAG: recombinase family protein [Phycisphaerales bacterium]|nr:recombinase family protein [Phycisphaerales bacterium]